MAPDVYSLACNSEAQPRRRIQSTINFNHKKIFKLKILNTMKIKNLFALVACALISTNAFAASPIIQRANLAFQVTKSATATAPAEVKFMGMVAAPAKTDADGAIANQPDGTITIPATTWTMDEKGNKTNYNVTGIDLNWANYGAGNSEADGYDAKKDPKKVLKKLVSEVVEKDGKKVISNLKATDFAALEEVVLPAGQTVIANNAFKGCVKLKTINLANIESYGSASFQNTAIESIDLTKATNVSNYAFSSVKNVKTLTIPATLKTIGEGAFMNMYAAAVGTEGEEGYVPAKGLEELVFNANDAFEAIPAVFGGDKLLKKITIVSAKATTFAEKAFENAEVLEELDLSGCTELTTIAATDFAASTAFKSIKLAGTKLTSIANLNMKNSKATLAEITFPATLESLPSQAFRDFVALKAIDLSATKVTEIPVNAFLINADSQPVDEEGNPIPSVLATVKLNPATTTIGKNAFKGQAALATIEGLNQENLESIGEFSFFGTALTALDLSATKLTSIPTRAFAVMEKLETVKLPETIDEIATAAFCYDAKVKSINLEDTEITELNAIFNIGAVGSTETPKAKEVAIALTSVKLPETLTKINAGALQLTDITEIEIPASVESIGEYAFQGCIKLEKFTWNEAKSRNIYNNVFRGDDKLKEVKMVTTLYGGAGINVLGTTTPSDPVDLIFKGNSKDVLKFIVNVEDYNALVAQGWTEANLKYCTLTTEGASEFEFKASGKSGEYYYATYHKDAQATWFPAEDFEVFGAVVEGSNVVMKPFTVEGGYYKVSTSDICVVRSQKQKAGYELKNTSFNDITTAPAVNELQVAKEDFTPSRIKYQYKFGSKNGVVAFYRVTSGTIKEGGVYIEASVAAARLNIIFEGEGDATAIQAIATEAENSGAVYNLNGVRVNKAQKGVYIQNGKKFVK